MPKKQLRTSKKDISLPVPKYNDRFDTMLDGIKITKFSTPSSPKDMIITANTLLTPDIMFQGNLQPYQYYYQHEHPDIMKSRHSMISEMRKKKSHISTVSSLSNV